MKIKFYWRIQLKKNEWILAIIPTIGLSMDNWIDRKELTISIILFIVSFGWEFTFNKK